MDSQGPKCITEVAGFELVCLNPFVLETACLQFRQEHDVDLDTTQADVQSDPRMLKTVSDGTGSVWLSSSASYDRERGANASATEILQVDTLAAVNYDMMIEKDMIKRWNSWLKLKMLMNNEGWRS
ncbi:hypothetical protein ACOMHN_037530 [Nucella lapillus]